MQEHISQPQRFPWRLFWLLIAIAILGALAIIPIAIDLFGPVVATAEAPPLPLPLIVFLGVVQNLYIITPLVVAAALSLNGLASVAFGVLYKKRGLEAGMIAHFTADFVIYVVGPAFLAT